MCGCGIATVIIMRKKVVGIIGASQCSLEEYQKAYDLGKFIAESGYLLVCGGLTGVMEGASKGATDAGGIVLGIIPYADPSKANPYVTIAVATGMGHARNSVIVNTSNVLVAVGGEYGTLSEIALALKMGKMVIALDSWSIPGVVKVSSVNEAIKLIKEPYNAVC
jgi:uncharacterized protein (TIGR00725 family)